MTERPFIYNADGSKRFVAPTEELADKIIKEKKTQPIGELAERLGVGVDFVVATIDQLREEGYGIGRHEGIMIRSKTGEKGEIFDASEIIDKYFKIGLVSDNHSSSKKERLEELHAMYDIFEKEGVNVVLHAGDITDGVGVYRGQEYEVHKFGQQQQIDYAVESYPRRKGIETLFITGNHCLKEYQRGGVDPGYPIARRRDDMTYLGKAHAKVMFPNGAIAELLHPDGGGAYALSYKAQKFINNLNPEDVPEMMMWGHYHNSFYMHYRNVHFVQAPCFKGAGIWEKRKGLNPTIGGWLIEGKISDYGTIDQFKPELFRFQGSEKR